MSSESLSNVFAEIDRDFDLNDQSINQAMHLLNLELRTILRNSKSLPTDAKQRMSTQLKSYQAMLLHRWASAFSEETRKNLFRLLQYQIYLDMSISAEVTRTYFDLSLDILTSESIRKHMAGHRSSTSPDDDFLFFICSIGCQAVYLIIDRLPSISISVQKTPAFFPWNETTENLLGALLVYVDRDIRHGPFSFEQLYVLRWIQNMLDIVSFVPFFIQTGYPTALLRWLSMEPKESTLNTQSWYVILDLLYNLVRHESAVQILNQDDAVSILKRWREHYLTEENTETMVGLYFMIYALLLDPIVFRQEEFKSIQLALDYSLKQTAEALKTSRFVAQTTTYRLSEILIVLTRFCVHDTCLLYMLEYPELLDLLVVNFLSYSELLLNPADGPSMEWNRALCSLLYRIFWSISFQPAYHAQLKANPALVQLVQRMAKHHGDDDDSVLLREAADGILFNLDLIEQPVHANLPTTDTDGVKVMVSYSHKDAAFCQKLVRILEDRVKGDIWVDFLKLQPPYEDVWEEIAEVITKCDVVVIIVTDYYCSSPSCRREVIHADKRQKRLIPVYQGTHYEPEDWFEIRVGSATWVRFGDQLSDEQVFGSLVKLINSHRKDSQPPQQLLKRAVQKETKKEVVVATPHQPMVRPESSALKQWTDDDVQLWLQLPPSTLHLSSGQALLTYANLVAGPIAQQDEYEQRFRNQGVSRAQFANMISSLAQLRSSQAVQFRSAAHADRWTVDEVRAWFEHNRLPIQLMSRLGFRDGMELVTYARTLISSQNRIDQEYDRLRCHQGENLQLQEYTRFVSSLKRLAEQSPSTSSAGSCQIL